MAEKRGQFPTYPGKTIGPIPGPTITTITLIKIIQTIEAFVKSTNWPKKTKDI